MTIRPGEQWGIAVARPPDLRIVASDAELAAASAEAGEGLVTLAAAAGDLHRAIGAPVARDRMQRVSIDRLEVDLDGARWPAVAHVVARGPWWLGAWWRGPIVAAANVDNIGDWTIAPRAHPNDGRFDTIEVASRMSLRTRLQARSRLPSGTHVPHPDVSTGRATSMSWTFERPMRVWIDGVARGRARRISVRIEPDAFELHI